MLRIGIIGLPNAGKSTLFSALTKRAVGIANYPFTTVDPNVGVVAVEDERLLRVAAAVGSARTVPAMIEFVDIAGLVRGAHKGEGLGNQFLAHIREVDAIVEVVRAFRDANVAHVEGSSDPVRDHEIVEAELLLKDLETVEGHREKVVREARAGVKGAGERLAAFDALRDALRSGTTARAYAQRFGGKKAEEAVRELALLTGKAPLVCVNSSSDADGRKTAEAFAEKGLAAVVLNARDARDASELSVEERREMEIEDAGLEALIREAFLLLDLIRFFTANANEAHAWDAPRGTLLPKAVGRVHSDFEEKFIRADVIGWKALVQAGGWAEARSRGVVRSEGKEYIVQDGEVIEVKHS